MKKTFYLLVTLTLLISGCNLLDNKYKNIYLNLNFLGWIPVEIKVNGAELQLPTEPLLSTINDITHLCVEDENVISIKAEWEDIKYLNTAVTTITVYNANSFLSENIRLLLKEEIERVEGNPKDLDLKLKFIK